MNMRRARSSSTPRLLASRASVLLALGVALLALAPAGEADAQLRANRLSNDTCLTGEFSSFDDVIMTALATHQPGGGDVYQAICDDEDCWGFSINRSAAVNVLTTGLTPGEYTWYVCAWNGSVRRVVANLAGGAALYRDAGARSADEAGQRLRLDDRRIPEDLRRFADRLRRTTGR